MLSCFLNVYRRIYCNKYANNGNGGQSPQEQSNMRQENVEICFIIHTLPRVPSRHVFVLGLSPYSLEYGIWFAIVLKSLAFFAKACYSPLAFVTFRFLSSFVRGTTILTG